MPDLSRIRVDQVGSLCPPAKSQEVFGRYRRGAATDEGLAAGNKSADVR
jgi:hypothetical protein